MFWRYNSASAGSQISTLLEKEDVGLREVLEQDDIIQECKNQNQKLVEYLVRGDVLAELIELIITEPSAEVEESTRYRLPHVAAEVLSCEVPLIAEKVASEPSLLSKLYSFIEQPPPLNPLLSSFFSKAFNVLVTRKSEQNWYSYQCTCVQVLEFLKGKEFVKHVLGHIGTSAIPDLVFGLITCVEATEIKQNMLNWLNEQQLIESIVGLLESEVYERDTHDNAARLLVELLRVSRDAQYVPARERCHDPLLAVLEAPSTITLILDTIFKHIPQPQPIVEDAANDAKASSLPGALGGAAAVVEAPAACNDSSIVNGVTVLLALLESRKAAVSANEAVNETSNPEDAGVSGVAGTSNDESTSSTSPTTTTLNRQQALLDSSVGAILPRLPHLTRLLTHPPTRSPLNTTAGSKLDPPLGATRLSVSKLICALLTTNNYEVITSLKELETVDVLIDLFFRYSLNNFLHAQVEQCINLVFAWTPPPSYMATSSSTTSQMTTSPGKDKAAAVASDDANVTPEDADDASMKDASEKPPIDEEKKEEEEEEKIEEDVEKNVGEDHDMKESIEASSSDVGGEGEGGEGDNVGKEEDDGDGDGDPDDDDDHVPNADLEWETTVLKQEAEKASRMREAAAIQAASYQNPLLEHLYLECKLVERVLQAWDHNESVEQNNQHSRKGYMAHLTRIANTMQHHVENRTNCHDLVERIMKQLPESLVTSWTGFVEGQLADTNERNTIVPANSYTANSGRHTDSSEDDDSDFREIQFHSETMQQMFSDYQMQQMSDNLVDSFGFNDGEEAAAAGGSMKRFLNFNFGLDEVSVSDEKVSESAAAEAEAAASSEAGKDLFDMVCKDRFSGGIDDDENDDEDTEDESPKKSGGSDDDEDGECEDPWASRTKEIKFDVEAKNQSVNENDDDDDSSDGDDKEDKDEEVKEEEEEENAEKGDKDSSSSGGGDKMEVDEDDDEWSILDRRATEVAPIHMEVGQANPWDSAGASSSPKSSFDEAFSSSAAAAAAAATTSAAAVATTDVASDAAAEKTATSTTTPLATAISSSGKEALNRNEGWADFSAFQSQTMTATTTDGSSSSSEGSPTKTLPVVPVTSSSENVTSSTPVTSSSEPSVKADAATTSSTKPESEERPTPTVQS